MGNELEGKVSHEELYPFNFMRSLHKSVKREDD